jgi:hypothetical protein
LSAIVKQSFGMAKNRGNLAKSFPLVMPAADQ